MKTLLRNRLNHNILQFNNGYKDFFAFLLLLRYNIFSEVRVFGNYCLFSNLKVNLIKFH